MNISSRTLQAGLAGFLALVAAVEWLAPAPEIEAPAPIAAKIAAAAGAADPSSFADRWQSIILARPLFRPDRRPLADAPEAAAAMPRLTAIVVTAAGSSAIFAGDDGKPVIVAPGGQVDGYTVQKIGPESVVLTGPAGSKTLQPELTPSSPADSGAAPLILPPHHFLDNE